MLGVLKLLDLRFHYPKRGGEVFFFFLERVAASSRFFLSFCEHLDVSASKVCLSCFRSIQCVRTISGVQRYCSLLEPRWKKRDLVPERRGFAVGRVPLWSRCGKSFSDDGTSKYWRDLLGGKISYDASRVPCLVDLI